MQNLINRYINAKKNLFELLYKDKLNDKQIEAVLSVEGPLLVLAGAGSGKTTVLVNRIGHIIRYGNAYHSDRISEGLDEACVSALEDAKSFDKENISQLLDSLCAEPVSPWNVLAFTFTNKAAREIKDRLASALPEGVNANDIWSGTFHSICVKILRRYGERLGYREGFSIYDTDDKKRLITMCMKELEISDKVLSGKTVANAISAAKDNLLSPEEYYLKCFKDGANIKIINEIKRVHTLYDQKLMANNAVDFDDIIMKTVELLNNESDVLEYYKKKFKYVLVDEYQDTNYAQFVLTSLLSSGKNNIMVVGDDDQSIYRFRGATVENILNFDKTYKEAHVVRLEQNYRSTKTILDAANGVIKRNTARHSKTLWCDRGMGEMITVHLAFDQNDEGKYIISEIAKGIAEGKKYSDYAILYRVNELARSLETTFAKSGVPYRVLGSMKFYDRKEIKDMLAYLFVVLNQGDTLRLKRIINEPKRKIGDATVGAVEEIAASLGKTPYEIMMSSNDYVALSKSSEKLLSFVSLIERFKVYSEQMPPSSLIEKVFEESGYHQMLLGEGFEGEGRIDAVKELVSGAVEYEKRCENEDIEPSLVGYLEEISLVSDVDKYDEGTDAVVLMTIHSAKGLEFPTVFLAGAEEGIFPSLSNIDSPEEMAEERRLAYVAITRAKDKLYVTHTRSRMMYGKSNSYPLTRFIKDEVPRVLLDIEEVRAASSYGQRYAQRNPAGGYSDRGGYGLPGYSGRTQTYSRVRDDSEDDYGRYSEYKRKQAEIENRRAYYNSSRNSSVANASKANKSAQNYGVERFESGTRVLHNMFGEGTIISSRDMGGDVLYEVKFDSGNTKKLMATFAKMKKI